MTDVDHRSAGRLMALTALFKNLIFIKCFGFSAGTSLLTGLKQPEIGNVQDDGNYSILSRRVVKVC